MGTSAVRKRSGYFDAVKGMLTLLVIAGHVIPGSIAESFPRYMIYTFHMPVFFMLSGYLLNVRDTLAAKPHQLLVNKYLRRIVLPWAIAVLLYYLLNMLLQGQRFSVLELVKEYIYPFYHLWYVWGFMFCTMSAALCTCDKQKYVLLVFGGIFLIGKYCFSGMLHQVLYYTVRPEHLFYFALGWVLKQYVPQIRRRWLAVTVGSTGVGIVCCLAFPYQDTAWAIGVKCLFSVLVFLSIIAFENRNDIPRGGVCCWPSWDVIPSPSICGMFWADRLHWPCMRRVACLTVSFRSVGALPFAVRCIALSV